MMKKRRTITKIEYYSYKQFEKDIKVLVKEINATQRSFKNIYAVPRGGLVLGVRLSHLLNLPLIDRQSLISQNTIICDEIVDTGKKLWQYHNYFVVCLHYKMQSCFIPKFFVHLIPNKTWIKYFWEKGGIELK